MADPRPEPPSLETQLRTSECDCDWMAGSCPTCAECQSETRPYRESVLHWDGQHIHEGCLLLRTLKAVEAAEARIATLEQQLTHYRIAQHSPVAQHTGDGVCNHDSCRQSGLAATDQESGR
jgi:hypothetical protein